MIKRHLATIVLSLSLALCSLLGCNEDPEKKYARLSAEVEQLTTNEKLEEARITLQSAIALKPDVAENYYRLAELLLRLRRFPEALENYRNTLNLNPQHRDARLHLAALMIVVHQYEQAESDLRKLIDADPGDFEARVLTANLDRARNKPEDARKTLLALLEEKPDDATALGTLGDLELSENHADLAEQYFKKAMVADPENETVRVALADLYAVQGRDAEAQELLSDVLKIHTHNTTLRLYYAEFLLGRGQLGKAREQFEEMLRTDPSLRDTRDRLFDMYLISKEPERAKKLVADLRAFSPEDASLSYFEGRVLELDNKREEALKLYLKTIQALTNFAPAFRRAGLLQLSLGEDGAALENLNHAIVINPLDVSARLALARTAFLRRDFSEAQGHVAKILERYPRHLAANVLRTDILLLEGKTTEARRFLEALAKLLPDAAVTSLKLGILDEQEGKTDAAIAAYEKFLAADSDVYVGAARLARLYVKRDGINRALAQLDRYLKSSKRSKGSIAFVMGSLLVSRGKPEDYPLARELLEQATLLNPEISQAYAALAQLDAMDGNFEAALSRYKKLLERNPKHISALMLEGLTYERMQKYSEAEQAYRAILTFAPDFAPAQNNLAWILAEHVNGNLDEAFQLAQRAKENLPQEAGVSDTLGWVYHKRGQSRAAVSFLAEAADLAQAGSRDRALEAEIHYHLGVVQQSIGELGAARQSFGIALERGGPKWSHADEIHRLLQGAGKEVSK